MGDGAKRAMGPVTGSMVPSPGPPPGSSEDPLRTTTRRILAIVAVSLTLVGGACSSGSKKASTPETTEATTSTTAAPGATRIATVKGATITVLSAKPANVTTTTAAPGASTTTTAPPTPKPGSLAAIPRDGLNSAAVKKVPTGFQFDNPTYFKNPLVFDVVEDDGEWLKVLIPARPNHTEGWIKRSEVELSSTTYRLRLDLATYTLALYKGDELVRDTKVAIGKDQTRTPLGRFYITEKIKQSNPDGFYGPWVLATNGYSEMLDTFDGGLPVVALHGTSMPELLGTQASNGCVRIANDTVSALADLIPAGTPIDIY